MRRFGSSPLRLLLLVLLLALPLAAVPGRVEAQWFSSQQAGEDDQGFLARQLQSLLSDAGRDVRIRGFEGALSSQARMAELSIADDEGVWLRLQNVTLDWSRAALLTGRVEVNTLSAERIELHRLPASGDSAELPSATASAPFSLPELPVAIRIGELRADTIFLGAPILGEEAEFRILGAVRLEGGQGEGEVTADRTDGTEGHFRVAGSFDNVSRQLVLDVALEEGPAGIASTLIGLPGQPAVALRISGDDPIENFSASLDLATDGTPRVTGDISFSSASPEDGTLLDGSTFTLDIAGDLRPLLVADLHGFFGDDTRLRASGTRGTDGEMSLNELSAVTGAMTLVGRADLAASGLPRLIDLQIEIGDQSGAPVVLPFTGAAASIHAASLLVEFDEALGPDWRVAGEIGHLSGPMLAVEALTLDARGLLGMLNGGSDGGIFDGDFNFAATGISAEDPGIAAALGRQMAGIVVVNVPAAGEPIRFEGFSLEGDTLALTGSGMLDGLRFEGRANVEAPDLSVFSGLAGRALSGAAEINATGFVEGRSGAFDLEAELATMDLGVDIAEADNLLEGRARIRVSALRDTEGTQLRNLEVTAGTLALAASGTIAPGASALDASFRLSDLSRLGAGYAGTLGLDARLREEGELRRLGFDGEMSDLALAELPGAAQIAGLFAGATRLDGEITERAGQVSIERLVLDGRQIEVDVSGTASAEAQDLALVLHRLSVAPLMRGASGTVSGRLTLQGEGDQRNLTADFAAPGGIRTGIAQLDSFSAAGVRLSGRARQDGAAFDLEQLRYEGTGVSFNTTGSLSESGALTVNMDGTIADLQRLVPNLQGSAQVTGRVARPADGSTMTTSLTVAGPSGLNLNASGTVSPDLRLNIGFNGAVEAGIANPFVQPATVQGTVNFEGGLNGPAALESLRLNARLTDGRFVQPGVAIAFGGIDLRADVVGSQADVRLSGQSLRGGQVQAEGRINLGRNPSVDLQATASALRIAQARLFEGAVSGTIRVAGPLSTGPTASGRIQIDEVEIRIPNSPLGRSGYVPEGIRHIGESAASRLTRENAGIGQARVREEGRGTPILLDLELEAPGRVFVRGRGLDAELGGTLRLLGSTHDVLPQGSFTLIRGRLDLLGSRFVLTEGSASMMGSFLPTVRLVASTEQDGVTTSVVLSGAADAPEISFESNPDLPDDEILARLIFRRSMSSLSPFQAAQLAMSVATLTGRSEGSFFSRARTSMGLDDLDITTADDGTTTLRAGRYITDRLYTDVGVNSEGQSELTIQFEINSALSLRGRTTSEGRSAVGVYYERDY